MSLRNALVTGLACILLPAASWSQNSVVSGTYTSNFDTLPSTGSTATFVLPAGTVTQVPGLTGWYGTKLSGTGTTAMNMVADNGNGNSGALYSYGATSSTERALGSLASGSNIGAFGAWFTNNSGNLFTSITLSFTSEFWRSSTVAQNILTFSYGFDTNGVSSSDFLTSASMIAEPMLNVVGPAATGTNGALNGNDPANQVPVSFTISNINWYNGASLFIRWTDANDGGNDAGLAIDNLTLVGVTGTSSDTLYWQAGSWLTTTGTGGSGTWQNGQASWDPSQQAIFGGNGGTVQLSGTVNANAGIIFNVDGYTLSNGTLALGDSEIVVFPNLTATIESEISGSQGLTKTGSGLLHLKSINSFTGAVTIDSGVLEIDSDANLGATSNGIVLGGGSLKTTSSVSLDSLRTVTGAGTLDVAAGTTLRVGGELNAALVLSNSGTVTLGAISNVSSLVFSSAGTLATEIGATLAGNISTTHTNGTAVLSGYYAFTTGTTAFTVANGSNDIDLNVASTLAGTTVFHKLGLGTVYISGNTVDEFTGGFRLGTVATGNGGRILLASGVTLGTAQFQFNWGTLEAEADSVYSVGISLGGREASRAVLAGADMIFNGDSALFEGTNQQSRLDVNNVTTLNGTLVQNSGTTFVGTGLTIGGIGTLILNGDASGQTRATTITDSATLVVNNSYGGNISVSTNATLKGTGTLLASLSVAGTHAVGNSAGTQVVQNGVSYLSNSTFEWELVANDDSSPGTTFDQLQVTGGNINIESGSIIELVFDVGSSVDWADTFWDSNHTWTVIDMLGAGDLLGGMFTISSNYLDGDGDLLSILRPEASFDVDASGKDVIVTYTAIPEPSTLAFLLAGFAVMGWILRRRPAARA